MPSSPSTTTTTTAATTAKQNAPVRALTAKQERRLRDYLETRFLDINRDYNKRAEPTTSLPTLSSYLQATRQLISLILQIPPKDPSTALRTSLLLHLTNEAFTSIVGYDPTVDVLPELADWLDDIDQAWVAVLRIQAWDPVSRDGHDIDYDEYIPPSRGVSQTDKTRLRSLFVGAEESLEEWLVRLPLAPGDDVQSVLERMDVEDGFNELFGRSLAELGALRGAEAERIGIVLPREENRMVCEGS